MTKKEVISKITSIALTSTKFKIGETGMTLKQRLSLYPEFSKIKQITFSRNKSIIDKLESEMNTRFFNWKNNSNKRQGSAGEMAINSNKYILYVVYVQKRKKLKTV